MTSKDEYTIPEQCPAPLTELFYAGQFARVIAECNIADNNQLLLRAEAHWQLNDYAAAHEDLRVLYNRDRQFPQIIRRIVQLLMDINEFTRAESLITRHLCEDPINTQNLILLGVLYLHTARYQPAKQVFQRILTLRPDHYGARFNLFVLSDALGDYDSSQDNLCAYLLQNATDSNAHYAKSTLNIRKNNLTAGFNELEYRIFQLHHKYDMQKYWLPGGPIPNSVFVFGEQGLGDEMQFARYIINLCQSNCERVVFLVKPNLYKLFCDSLVHPKLTIICEIPPQLPTEKWVYLLSLPARLGVNAIDSIPYLRANPTKTAHFAQKLGPKRAKYRVGLAWTGSGRNNHSYLPLGDKQTIPHHHLPQLLHPDWECHSLQIDYKNNEPALYPQLIDHAGEIKDFSDTAALVENMDFVIVIDSSICHLVGGLGKRAFLLLPRPFCWRWGLDNAHHKWYKNMNIIASTEITGKNGAGWDGVIQQLQQRVHHE